MGFTVKANSEGQPGPQDFGYDHGDGANGIAAAVAPLDMKVYWRTFVYNAEVDPDRLKRAYLEFGPIDDEDRFLDNVFLQTKNGPLDFQAREPIHPMFGRMENTNQALELQVTQEYTGQSTMLAYLGPMWEEVLKTETHAPGRVGEIVDGTAQNHEDTAIVGVANLGNADNLTGHHFSQANLFAFGRQAWDWKVDSDDVAEDWVRMTWTNDDRAVRTIVEMMMGSWEALVSYQTPLGIGHQFRSSDHYGPKPDEFFIKDDWSPVYYNQADSEGLGYDRSPTGSNFTAQYFPPLERRYGNLETVPENLMMWFHHVPWGHRMDNGRVFWDELVLRYQTGVQYVTWMRETWDRLEPYVDARRFAEVRAKLAKHEADAADWRDTSVGYWRQFSHRPIPVDGPLAVEITVGGKRFGGFDASAASYTIPVPAGASPRITRVRTSRGARYRILEQTHDRAIVQVRGGQLLRPDRQELRVRAGSPAVVVELAGLEQLPRVDPARGEIGEHLVLVPVDDEVGDPRLTATGQERPYDVADVLWLAEHGAQALGDVADRPRPGLVAAGEATHVVEVAAEPPRDEALVLRGGRVAPRLLVDDRPVPVLDREDRRLLARIVGAIDGQRAGRDGVGHLGVHEPPPALGRRQPCLCERVGDAFREHVRAAVLDDQLDDVRTRPTCQCRRRARCSRGRRRRATARR